MRRLKLLNTTPIKLTLLTLASLPLMSAMTLDQYLEQSKTQNPLLRSFEPGMEAAQLKFDAAELELAPTLTAGYVKTKDKSLPNQLSTLREMDQYTLGLSKKFVTGTSLKIESALLDAKNVGTTLPGYDQYTTGAVNVTIQQSLWKDFFGVGTRKRLNRLRASAKLETASTDLQRRAALLDVESSFWDYAVALEDLKLKKSNLDRAQKIERWTSNRVGNGISDRADLMSVKALAALREVQLQTAEDEVKTQEVRFRENLGLAASESTPEIKADLTQTRPYITNLSQQKNIIKLDAYIASLEAATKGLVAQEVQDNLRPDLSVFGSYATTSYNRDRSTAIDDITQKDYPKSQVGVSFTWAYETDAKSATRESAAKDALASQLKAEKKMTEGRTAWLEILRRYEVTKKNVLTLEKVAEYQRERAKAEQNKFANGRTVTMNVVTAETDSAEAEVNLLKAKSGLRKLEASSLLFTAIQE